MTQIVGVHGIGNYRRGDAAAALGAEWTEALGARVRVAYYADLLHRGTAQGPEQLEAGEQELLLDWVEQLQRVPEVAQGTRTARARAAVDWLSRHFGPAATAFALAFTQEVHTYLASADGPRRNNARRRVASVIGDSRPRVVIAHSLGSVVAFEALHAYPTVAVDLLLTLGSPLGMPGAVLERLGPPRTRPPGVRRWVNVTDVGDLVAIPRGGLGALFGGVDEDVELTIGTWDFHTARGYLGHPDVRGYATGAG